MSTSIPKLSQSIQIVVYLLMGLIYCFSAGLSCLSAFSFSCLNLQSMKKEPQVVDVLLAKEVNKGYMIGPFDKPLFKHFRINTIGIST